MKLTVYALLMAFLSKSTLKCASVKRNMYIIFSKCVISIVCLQAKMILHHPKKYLETFNSMKLLPYQNPDDRPVCYIVMSPMSSDTFNTFLVVPILWFPETIYLETTHGLGIGGSARFKKCI